MQLFNHISPEDVETIHQTALTILQRFGVRVEDPALRRTLAEHGCTEEGDRVKFRPDDLEKMIAAKTPVLRLKGHNGGPEVVIGEGPLKSHATSGIPWVIDLDSGKPRAANYRDLVESIIVMNHLPNLDLPCALIFPEDLPAHYSQVAQTACMFENCTKAIYGPGVSNGVEAKYIVELTDLYSGGRMAEEPIGAFGVSPESPLNFPKPITDAVRHIIAGGIPMTLLCAPVGGFSSPLSLAGALAQLHAEILAFGYVAFAINPKTPTIYGARQFFANMKNGQAITGLPEVGMASAVSCHLARRANMVSDVYGLCCTSGAYDSQSGFEKALNGLLPVTAGADIISGYGSMASLMASSLAQLVIDEEIFSMIKRIHRGFEVNESTLGLEVIEKALSGRNFIEQAHTLKELRSGAVFQPKFGFASAWNDWLKDGREIGVTAAEAAKDILAKAEPVVVDEKLKAEAARILKAADREAAALK